MLSALFRKSQNAAQSCHGTMTVDCHGLPKVVIVGNPNVGKSVVFNYLTGAYVTVSNYPGTTVEVSRGKARIKGAELEIVDTPGMYSLLPITEEERVARSILLAEHPEVVLHVVDARNLERMLPLTLQLVEAGLPVVLVANIMDEAERAGIHIDLEQLSAELGIPVIGTVAAAGRGMKSLLKLIYDHRSPTSEPAVKTRPTHYGDAVEEALTTIVPEMRGDYRLSPRSMALLLLQGDEEISAIVKVNEHDRYRSIDRASRDLAGRFEYPLAYVITLERQKLVKRITDTVMRFPAKTKRSLGDVLGGLVMRPVTGIPILLLVLYFGLYQFVGVFGAGTLVDFLENTVFGRFIIPPVDAAIKALLPVPMLQDLLIGEYGIITLGVRYAVAIILPIVGTFFLFFSVAEDTGYFPRLAMLVDRLFKAIGLNGRAVIPMVLGFGCDTMATMTTRILETKRERMIATFLLALAIPCSAQLGVILALLSKQPGPLAVWAAVEVAVFILVGWLTARLLPGPRPSFYMELPPLRLPKLENVLAKTFARMQWYLAEIFPIFIWASVLIWLGRLTGVFQVLIRLIEPAVVWLGLPKQTAVVYLFGFFRRDYGAAGLFDLVKAGLLTPAQLTVAAVTLTLFIPCVAQFSVMLKERGVKAAVAMAAFIFPFAFVVGRLVSMLLAAWAPAW